jgi:hypothetical protein
VSNHYFLDHAIALCSAEAATVVLKTKGCVEVP